MKKKTPRWKNLVANLVRMAIKETLTVMARRDLSAADNLVEVPRASTEASAWRILSPDMLCTVYVLGDLATR